MVASWVSVRVMQEDTINDVCRTLFQLAQGTSSESQCKPLQNIWKRQSGIKLSIQYLHSYLVSVYLT